MASFAFPDFYLPWPARLNPHLEGARVHTNAWARQMGMIEPPDGDGAAVWDEDRFNAMDFALFASLTHPDACAAELDLISGWYVWGWYVDDYFPHVYSNSSDLTDAKEYLLHLLTFMPADGTAAPCPGNPLERGLVDLWSRTAPTKSDEWRCRFSQNIRNLAEEALRELFNLGRDKNRVLDPIEYIEVRREVGGLSWSAQLLEHALGLEIPTKIFHTRQVQVLNGTFADSEGLRNDIISYEIDMAESKVNNGVVVAQHFLDCDLQDAVDFVNDLVTGRLHQFENTVATELNPLFEEYPLGPIERDVVLRYVQGLKDWMAGNFEWALRPEGRYLKGESGGAGAPAPLLAGPTGLGTAGARLGLSRRGLQLRSRSYKNPLEQAAEPFALPKFYMPFSARLNPNLDATRKHSKAWIRQTGMLDARGFGIWNESDVDSFDIALIGALTHPDAPVAELDLLNDWYVWGLIEDDFLLELYKRRRDLIGAKAFVDRLQLFVPVDSYAMPVPSNPVEHGLADLWSRTAPALSVEFRREFAGHVVEHARAGLWEVANLAQNRVPELVDYVEMRRRTLGMGVMARMIRYAAGETTSTPVYRSRPMRALVATVSDWAGWVNDIVSYQMEIEFEGEVHNGVLAFQRFLNRDLPSALAVANNLVTSRLRQFEYIVAIELPALFDELALDTRDREGVVKYVQLLQDWIAGFLQWQLETGRYKDFRSRTTPVAALLRGLTGLGTSAARLGSGWNGTSTPA